MKKETSWSCSRWKLWCRRMVWLLSLQPVLCTNYGVVMKFAKLEMYCANCVFVVACMYVPSCMCTFSLWKYNSRVHSLMHLDMYIWLCDCVQNMKQWFWYVCACVAWANVRSCCCSDLVVQWKRSITKHCVHVLGCLYAKTECWSNSCWVFRWTVTTNGTRERWPDISVCVGSNTTFWTFCGQWNR